MASAKIEDRKKYLGGPWDAIRGKNAVLDKGLFKPPMDPLVTKYDKCKEDYDKLVEKRKSLKAVFEKIKKAYSTAGTSSQKLHDEFDKAKGDEDATSTKNYDLLNKYGAADDPDSKDVMAAMTGLIAAFDDASVVRKSINDKLSALNAGFATEVKKLAAEYKTAADAVESGIKKLEAEMNGLDDQIRKLVQNYQQIAIKADHEDAADAVRSLLSFMP